MLLVLEMVFIADEDKGKRSKVVLWLVDDGVKVVRREETRVAMDRVRLLRPIELGTGKISDSSW